MNSKLISRQDELNEIKTTFQTFINDNINTKINNKYKFNDRITSTTTRQRPNALEITFNVNISISSENNIINNIITSINPNQNLVSSNYMYRLSTRSDIKNIIQYGMYVNAKKIFFIVKIMTSVDKFDIHLVDITSHINRLKNFYDTNWFRMGKISCEGFNTCYVLGGIPGRGNGVAEYTPLNRNELGYLNYNFAYRLNDPIKPFLYFTENIYNSTTSQSFKDIHNYEITRSFGMPDNGYIYKTLYSNIEIFVREFNGECRTSDNKYPPYFDFPNTPTLNDCKNLCTQKNCTDYQYNQNDKKCRIYNPKVEKKWGTSKLMLPDGSASKGTTPNNSNASIRKGTNDNNWKCYSQKNQDGDFLDALVPPPPSFAYLSNETHTYYGSCMTSDDKYPSWKSLQKKTYQNCKNTCNADSNCKAYAYSPDGSGGCQIFTTTPGTNGERLFGNPNVDNTNITKGDGSVFWKCYLRKNQDGDFLDAPIPQESAPAPAPVPPAPAPIPQESTPAPAPTPAPTRIFTRNGSKFEQIPNRRCSLTTGAGYFTNLNLDEALNKCATLSNLGGSNKPCVGITKDPDGKYFGCLDTYTNSSMPNNSWIKTG